MKKISLGIIILILLGVVIFMTQSNGQAIAIISGTVEGSAVSGRVKFFTTPSGLKIKASLENVSDPGKHGFHIHEFGSCDNNGKAAGGHFNPAGVKHGLLVQDGPENAHAGDMGNIVIDANGNGTLVTTLPGLGLSEGANNIAGRAVILHAKEDDFGQPTGNAGSRIGCGTIVLTGK